MKHLISILLSISLMLGMVLPASAAEQKSGYTVTMPEDQTVISGESVSVPVKVSHTGNVSKYNAVDMTFTYDASVLKLTSTSIQGFTVIAGDGAVRVLGYGKDRAVGSNVFTLTFQALNVGTTNVRVTSARVDISNHAISNDAPYAILKDAATAVEVSGYPVTLPNGFEGEPVAKPSKDYTFSAADDDYAYDITVKVDGKEIGFIDNGDGTYTIPAEKITGAIVITVSTKTPSGSNAVYNKLWITPYVELDGVTVYLIAVCGDPGTNKTYAYGGKVMYYTEKYDSPVATFGEKVYVYLEIIEQGETFTPKAAASKITTMAGGKITLDSDFDVNESTKIDVNDAQLVYDIYNGLYENFEALSMRSFLNADVSVDGVLNVADAAAVVDAML